MATFTFPSLTRNGVCYRLHGDRSALWDQGYRRAGAVCDWLGSYLTFGDGQTQHSPEGVVTVADLADALESLATEAINNPDVAEVLSDVWPYDRLSTETIDFLLDVRNPKEDPKRFRTTYYSVAERKVTTSDKAQHDRRYFRVPDSENVYLDGGPRGAWALLCKASDDEHSRWLERIVTYVSLYERAQEFGRGGWGDLDGPSVRLTRDDIAWHVNLPAAAWERLTGGR